MVIRTEQTGFNLLTDSLDPQGRALQVSRVNLDQNYDTRWYTLTGGVGGKVAVTASGRVTYDDTGVTVPLPDEHVLAGQFTYRLSNGASESRDYPVQVVFSGQDADPDSAIKLYANGFADDARADFDIVPGSLVHDPTLVMIEDETPGAMVFGDTSESNPRLALRRAALPGRSYKVHFKARPNPDVAATCSCSLRFLDSSGGVLVERRARRDMDTLEFGPAPKETCRLELSFGVAGVVTQNRSYEIHEIRIVDISGPAVSAGGTPADLVRFGALTRAGEGGIAVTGGEIAAGNDSGHFEIANGYLVPTAQGEADKLGEGVYAIAMDSGETVEIDVVGNTMSAASAEEILSIIALGAPISGRTIEIRPGTHDTWNQDFRELCKDFTEVVTLRPSDVNDRPTLTGMELFAMEGVFGNVTFEDLNFALAHDAFGAINPHIVKHVVQFSRYGDGVGENITFRRCDVDCLLGAYEPGVVELPGLEASGIGTKLGISGLLIEDCTFHNMVNALSLCGDNITVRGCSATQMWGDFARLGPRPTGGDTFNVDIFDNVFTDWAGSYANYRHADFIQAFPRGGSLPGGDVHNVRIHRNTVFPGATDVVDADGKGNGIQFMLFHALVNEADIYRDFSIKGNVAYLQSGHGVTFEHTIQRAEIEGNTFLPAREPVADGVVPLSPQIFGPFSDSVIRYNVCHWIDTNRDGYHTGNTVYGNYVGKVDPTDLTSYSDIFQGSTFEPADRQDALEQARLKPLGPLDRNGDGAVSTNDIGAVGTTLANGIGDFVNETINEALLPAIPEGAGPGPNVAVDAGFDNPAAWDESAGINLVGGQIVCDGSNAAWTGISQDYLRTGGILVSEITNYAVSVEATRVGVPGKKIWVGVDCLDENGREIASINLTGTRSYTVNDVGTIGPLEFTTPFGTARLLVWFLMTQEATDMDLDNLVVQTV
ncbi:hypothetical protein CLV78_10444 [Aliiruegeria haliotis]|uniref:Uncharacterized protein n=1 Tax=Aliiruegeria haliotis TaxID=1280846 RepID=A0A2T0RQT3_9RHOB|nr:hypothetical protein [Aliiruegeria haliotis]PRY23554.1 hypothetical protein CLV78_10444 [Aliiruegeria haliotis]